METQQTKFKVVKYYGEEGAIETYTDDAKRAYYLFLDSDIAELYVRKNNRQWVRVDKR